jgi:hypothetical protein
MTPKKQSKEGGKDSGGRGSAEAIEKRRTARQLNTLLGAGKSDGRMDGRTAKRRERLIRELKDGRRGRPLKPTEMVSHVDELMTLGETLGSLAKLGVKPLRIPLTADLLDVIERMQKAYNYNKQAWKILGVTVPEGRGKRSKG